MSRMGLKVKLSLVFSVLVVTICLVLGTVLVMQARSAMRDDFVARGMLLAQNLAYNSRYGVFAEDPTALDDLVEGVLRVDDVVSVAIVGPTGHSLAYRTRGGADGAGTGVARSEPPDGALVEDAVRVVRVVSGAYEFSAPVSIAPSTGLSHFPQELLEERVAQPEDAPPSIRQGIIRLRMSPARLDRAVRRISAIAMLVAALLMGGGVTVVAWLSRFFTRPLERLAATAAQIARGNLLVQTPVTSRDEIGDLAAILNQMTQALALRDHQIAQHAECLQSVNAELTTVNATLEERVQARTRGLEEAIHAIDHEKRKTELIIHEMTDGVVVSDPSGSILLINQAARTLLGMDMDHVDDLVTLARRLPCVGVLLTNPGDPAIHEMQIERDGGELTRILKVTQCPLRGDHGHLSGMVAVFHDVTRFKEVDRLKSEFVAHVSHELRTPLTSIKGSIDNLLDEIAGCLNGRQKDYLHLMAKHADRLVRLINDVLDVSRIESGTMEIRRTVLSLTSLIAEVVGAVRPIATAKGIEIVITPSEAPAPVCGDWDKLVQVFVNLLDNAIKFTPPAGRISITLAHHPEFVTASIRDTGVGISEEDQARIFDRFYRVDAAAHAPVPGTGLGLCIAKHLIELHEGRIWVTSEPGKGSEFSLTLPRSGMV